MNASRAFSVYYLFDAGPEPQGWGGNDRGGGSLGSWVEAIDYKTGQVRWSHKWESGARSGLMSTAGNLVFAGVRGFLRVYRADTGQKLLDVDTHLNMVGPPMTFMLDGKQYVAIAGGPQAAAGAGRGGAGGGGGRGPAN